MHNFIENKKYISLLVFLGVLVIGLMLPVFLMAEEPRLELAWPETPMGTVLTRDSTIINLVQYLFEWAITLGGLAGFIALIIAGFYYLTSAGDPNKMKEAKDRIVSVFLGLALLFGSYLILTIIDPELVELRPPAALPLGAVDVQLDLPAIPIGDPCEKVIFYSGATYGQGHPGEIRPSPKEVKCGSLGKGISINSLEIIGSCYVGLYSNIGCDAEKEPGRMGTVSHIADKENPNYIRNNLQFNLVGPIYGISVINIGK